MKEIWKDIDFSNGEYRISNKGRVKKKIDIFIQNVMNRLHEQKFTDNNNPIKLSKQEIKLWNSAITICCDIVERRLKAKLLENNFNLPYIINNEVDICKCGQWHSQGQYDKNKCQRCLKQILKQDEL